MRESSPKFLSIPIRVMLAFCLATLLLASSCSAVFKAGLSGTIRDAESDADPKEGIANVRVFAYTIESARDTDFAFWQADETKIGYFDSYVAMTNTADDGTFTINRLVWHTTTPAFGKTADYHDIWLIYWHEDYGLQTNAMPVTVISDSTNANAVDELLTKANMIVNLEVTVRDVADDTLLDSAVTIRTSVDQGEAGTADDQTKETTVTGTGTVSVSYPRTMASPPVAKVSAFRNGSIWLQCTNDGTLVDIADGMASDPLSASPTEVLVHMKRTEHDMPTFSGQGRINYLAGDESKLFSDDDNIAVWLGYRDDDGDIARYDDEAAQTLTYSQGDGSNGQMITHGVFTGLGTGMTWDDDSYTGTVARKTVLIIVDADNNRMLGIGDRYVEATVSTTTGTKSLGALTVANTTAVVADDL